MLATNSKSSLRNKKPVDIIKKYVEVKNDKKDNPCLPCFKASMRGKKPKCHKKK